GRCLALRLGGSGPAAPVALCGPGDERLLPLTPDDDARSAWVGLYVKTARSILEEVPARSAKGSLVVDRATVLPSAAELAESPQAGLRLRRLGRLGRTVA